MFGCTNTAGNMPMHWRTFLLPLLFLCLLAPLSASAGDQIKLRVTIKPASDGIDAHFELAHPVAYFTFANRENEVRDQTWTITSPRTRNERWKISAESGALSAFDVHIAPRNEQTDASYPSVFRIEGASYGLYASYFVGQGIETILTFDLLPDETVLGLPTTERTWRVDSNSFRQPGHRYLYVGSKSLIADREHAIYVAPRSLPPRIRKRIERRVEQALAYYSSRVGIPLRRRPLVILALGSNAREGTGMQGDVTFGPAVALRMFGTAWASDSREERLAKWVDEAIDYTVPHEVAHFWNSGTYTSVAVSSGPWLHEGGAEYWSLRARMAFAGLAKAAAKLELENALNTCVATLATSSMNGPRNAATYACGEVVQWFSDTPPRPRSAGRRDIFGVWRAVFEHAEQVGGAYSAAAFIAAAQSANPDASAILELLIKEEGGERWSNLPALAAKLGIVLTPATQDEATVRRTIIRHLLRQACGDRSQGMLVRKSDIQLDTGERCGPLSGDPIVDAVNGKDLFDETLNAYETVARACATRGKVTLTSRTGTEKSMTCEKPLPSKLFAFHVKDAGF